MAKIFESLLIYCFLIGLFSCKQSTDQDFSYQLGGVGAFSEVVAAGVKRMALSAPMSPEQMDLFIPKAREIAESHGVSVFRESNLIVTDLFPTDIARGLDVLVLYQGTTLDAYLSLKNDKEKLEADGYTAAERRAISRRFGRLLSYTPSKINQLLAENTSYRTMMDFGLKATNLFLYYRDLSAAVDFYNNTLGLEIVADYDMAVIFRVSEESFMVLVDEKEGMHSAEEPKTVALALLTDQLDQWYDHLVQEDVKMKYDYNPRSGNAHDGFVIEDPEGYLLEFERFKQHPENEKFIPLLESNSTIKSTNPFVPENLGFHSSITWLYYKDLLSAQNFYEEVIGIELVADQGWTKIYQVSSTGFIGLVDERRGMHSFSEEKAVNVSFILDDVEGWHTYLQSTGSISLRDTLEIDSENRYKAFVGFDPEGYFLEFDSFYERPINTRLMDLLNDSQ